MFQLASLNGLRKKLPSLDKLIFMIDLKIESVRPDDSYFAEMDFSYVSSSNIILLRSFWF